MSYQKDIYQAVLGSAALAALIGDRFSWDIADGTTQTPYLVAQSIEDSARTDLDGKRELSFPLIQFTCWARTKTEAIRIMKVFAQEMEGHHLPGASETSLGFAGEHSSYDNETKLFGQIYQYRASVTN